jgi:hypothetical protein
VQVELGHPVSQIRARGKGEEKGEKREKREERGERER